MGWMTGNTGVQFVAGQISSLPYPDQLWDPPRLLSNGCSSPGVNWPWNDVDYLPSSSAEVENEWSCTSAPSYVFGL